MLRDDFTAQSDVDVLVEFEPGHTPGLGFFTMQRELSEILGNNADLITANDLSPYFKQEVLDEAEVVGVWRREVKRSNTSGPGLRRESLHNE